MAARILAKRSSASETEKAMNLLIAEHASLISVHGQYFGLTRDKI
jgi:hypothetical protein